MVICGFPLMVEAFEGNTAETATMMPTTMMPAIEAFMAVHRFANVTIVADPRISPRFGGGLGLDRHTLPKMGTPAAAPPRNRPRKAPRLRRCTDIRVDPAEKRWLRK